MSEPQRQIAVYDGRTYIGAAIGSGKSWAALDAMGNPLPGAFNSMKAAASAVSTSFASSCVADTTGRRDGTG
jgi:hypothetical protein